MQHTTNYSLPQWEASDRITRSVVNGAMSSIDSAIKNAAGAAANAGDCSVETFTYTGTGTYGESGPTVVTFPHKPELFLIFGSQAVLFGQPERMYGVKLGNNTTCYAMTPVWDGNTVSFYSINNYYAANDRNETAIVVSLYRRT